MSSRGSRPSSGQANDCGEPITDGSWMSPAQDVPTERSSRSQRQHPACAAQAASFVERRLQPLCVLKRSRCSDSSTLVTTSCACQEFQPRSSCRIWGTPSSRPAYPKEHRFAMRHVSYSGRDCQLLLWCRLAHRPQSSLVASVRYVRGLCGCPSPLPGTCHPVSLTSRAEAVAANKALGCVRTGEDDSAPEGGAGCGRPTCHEPEVERTVADRALGVGLCAAGGRRRSAGPHAAHVTRRPGGSVGRRCDSPHTRRTREERTRTRRRTIRCVGRHRDHCPRRSRFGGMGIA